MSITVRHHPQFKDTKRDGSAHNHGARIAVATPFAFKDLVRKLPGARWSPDHRVWHVPASVEAAGAVLDMFSERTMQADRDALALMGRALDARDAQAHKDPSAWHDLPQFPSRTVAWGHQLAGFHSSVVRDGAGLGMDMGTGKSKVVVGLHHVWGSRLTAILCPPKVVKVWPREFTMHAAHQDGCPRALPQPAQDDDGAWLPSEPGVTLNLLDHEDRDGSRCTCGMEPLVWNGRHVVGRSGRPLKNPTMKQRVASAQDHLVEAARHRRSAVLVCNYEAAWQATMATFFLDPLAGLPYDVQDWYRHGDRSMYGLAVVDEGHKIKAPGGKWSRFAHRLGQKSVRRVDATGTVMPHSEPDVYAQARFLDEGVFGTSFSKFQHRYFEMGGFENREIQRDNGADGFVDADAKAEFTAKLGQLFFFCDADDVLDLPPVLPEITHTCKLGDEASKAYAELEDEFITWLAALPDTDDSPVVADNVLVQLLRFAQITSGHLPVDGEIVKVDDSKARLLEDTLEDIGVQGLPVVVFGRFRHDLDVIRSIAAKLGLRYGEISGRQDDLGEDGRMPEGVFDIMGVQLQAGGVGIDLTAACYAVYYSLDFSLGNFDQSRKRLHRPGQTRPVRYIFLAAENTVDETIAAALAERKDIVGSLQAAAKRGSWG